MYTPVNEIPEQNVPTTNFYGLDYNEEIREGYFSESVNMTNEDFPILRTRRPQALTHEGGTVGQGALKKKNMAVVRDKYLYWAYGNTAVNSSPFSSGDKQLVSFGAYVIVFPDGFYFNTENASDKGYINRSYNTRATATTFTLCKQDGSAYATPTVDTHAPDNPQNGDLWIDTTQTPHVLNQYSAQEDLWTQIPTVYVKIAHTGIGDGLKMYDSVEISGIVASGSPVQDQLTFMNGTMIVYDCGTDYIVVAAIIDQAATLTDDIHVDMNMPSMDYVCESNNRLWGCKYGIVNGQVVNEIYASKLGDFRNWKNYMGLSTDSYAVSVGSDGSFTGCINYLGYPIFFKENMIHKIYGTAPSNYQVQNTIARGVQKGSWRSLTVIDEKLYYKSPVDIVVYDGSLPQKISDDLGDSQFKDAVFGSVHGKLYACMTEGTSKKTFVYDPRLNTWQRQTLMYAIYFGDDANSNGILIDTHGAEYKLTDDSLSETIDWELKTGRMNYGYRLIDKANWKLLKCELRMRIEHNAYVRVYAEYDDSGVLERAKEFRCGKLNTYILPIFIHKCDHVRLYIKGQGRVSLFGINKIYTQGANR